MTATITVKWQHPGQDVPLEAQTGVVYAQPMQGWIAGDTIVNVTRQKYPMVDGAAVLVLPDDTARVWKVEQYPVGSRPTTDYVIVPPDAGELAYTTLVKVDPETAQPTPEELANALQVVGESTVVTGAVQDGDLILTRGDGATINAGPVTGPKGDQGDKGDQGEPAALTVTVNGDGTYTIEATTDIVTPAGDGSYTIGA